MISYWYSWIQPCWMHLLSVFVSWLTLAIGGTAYHNGAIFNFELEFALKYSFFNPSMHFQAMVSSKYLIVKRNSVLVTHPKFYHPFFHWYIWMQSTLSECYPCHFLSFLTRYFCLILDSNCKFWQFDTSQFLFFCYRFTCKWQNFGRQWVSLFVTSIIINLSSTFFWCYI